MTPNPIELTGTTPVDISGPVAVTVGDVLARNAAGIAMLTTLGHTAPEDQLSALLSVIVTWCAEHERPGEVMGILINACVAGLMLGDDVAACG